MILRRNGNLFLGLSLLQMLEVKPEMTIFCGVQTHCVMIPSVLFPWFGKVLFLCSAAGVGGSKFVRAAGREELVCLASDGWGSPEGAHGAVQVGLQSRG
jgi:hypothetical protein